MKERSKTIYAQYLAKLRSIGVVGIDALDQRYGENILKSTMFQTNEYGIAKSGYCYEGALLDFVCMRLTPYALQEAELLRRNDGIDIPTEQIVKVCLLCFISKSVFLIPNDSDYEVKKGKLFKYDDNVAKYATKQGMKSLMMCFECGIQLNDEEVDAMTIMDRVDDFGAKTHCSMLAFVVKRAYEKSLKILNYNLKQQK